MRTESLSRLASTLISVLPASVYSVATGKTILVRGIILHNAGEESTTVKIHHVSNSEGTVDKNKLFEIVIEPKQTDIIDNIPIIMNAGDQLFAYLGEVNRTCSLQVYGAVVTDS